MVRIDSTCAVLRSLISTLLLLIRLNVCYERNDGTHHGLGLDLLFDALHRVKHTLTDLITSQEIGEDSCYISPADACGLEPQSRSREELSKMLCLQRVTLPYPFFLGWTRKKTTIGHGPSFYLRR